MEDKFYAAIREFGMLTHGDTVVVGVSGGADSMCLLDLMVRHGGEFGVSVAAAHVNHCLRGEESDRDEAFVRDYCEVHGVPLHVLRVDVNALCSQNGESTELCARNVRYEFFASLGYTRIATAHTCSDAAETLLMNLSRGAALNGLCSIPPVRENVIRPLIFFTREETEAYCGDHGLGYVTDSSNLTDDYTRNKIRHTVMQPLKRINPAFERNVSRCIASLREDNDFLEEYAGEVYRGLLRTDGALDTAGLAKCHKAVRYRVLSRFFSEMSGADFEKKHIDLIDGHLNCASFAAVLPGDKKAVINNGRCFFAKEINKDVLPETSFNKNEAYRLCTGDRVISFFASEPRKTDPDEIAVDFYKINDIIFIRSRREGDSLKSADRRCTKTLKKLFNELKIPPEERGLVPVLCDGDGVIWCAAGGVDLSRVPDKNTKKYLIIKTEGGKND